MTNIEERIYAALKSSADLVALLPEGADGIDHFYRKDADQYPIVIYQTITDVPELAADNAEVAHRVTVQISTVTEDGDYDAIGQVINKVMISLGFMRQITVPITEDNKKIETRRYVIREEFD